ncbi:MAG: NADPH-dependent F420 reductase [Rhodobacteraceae bacterium]|nr:MAG: NADPH-dependent F420 reductase [Paracoccaceae bacterium]
MSAPMVIAVIGATGALGGGIAARLAKAGYEVVLGSRDAARAEAAAEALRAETGGAVSGASNLAAAERAEIVFVSVPFASQAATLAEIAPAAQGKIVVDATVPLVPPKVARVQLPPEGSAAAIAEAALGAGVRLVTGFHNVSAAKLRGEGAVGCDVLVFGDDVAARDVVIDLVGAMGLRGVHGGPLANSAAAEAMTSVLIAINRRYKVADGAGLRITGLGDAD